MRSLFAKILLWFLATAVIDFVGAVVISAFDLNPWQSPFGRMMYVEEKAAQTAFEDRRRRRVERFRTTLSRGLRHVRGPHRRAGRDLLTGKDYSASLKRDALPLNLLRPGNGVIPHRSSDGRYYLILILRPRASGPGSFRRKRCTDSASSRCCVTCWL